MAAIVGEASFLSFGGAVLGLGLAHLLRAQRRFKEALGHLDQAVALDPGGGTRARNWRALVLVRLARCAEAQAALEQVVAARQESAAQAGFMLVRLWLGCADRQTRAPRRALALAEQQWRRHGTLPWAENLALAHAALGAFEQAVAWQRAARAAARKARQPARVLARLEQRLARFLAGRAVREPLWLPGELTLSPLEVPAP